MRIYSIFVMLPIAISAAVYATDRDAFSVRDLTDNSYIQPLQVRGPDTLVLDIHRRGLRLSKTSNGAPQHTSGKQVLASTPKTEKPLQSGGPQKSGSVKIPTELQNAVGKTLPFSLGSGKITRRPQTLQSSEPISPSIPRKRAGGGTIGHSRIPPRVPKDDPRAGRMQIPPSPAEEIADKSSQSQNANEKAANRPPWESKTTWDPSEEGHSSWRRRPPALQSIDDF